jgi:cytochrome c oxidase cbb3-type subunit II
MNRGPLIFLGVFVSMAVTWYGMLVAPSRQMGGQQQANVGPANERYPIPRLGPAHRGAEVYRSNGCAYCHTQQVRPQGYGADFERGWGLRMSAAQDFLFEETVALGQVRMGPDLANVGFRLTDEAWHYAHLYNPKSKVTGSLMPQYPFLFKEQPIKGSPSSDALVLTGAFAPPTGVEIVPTKEARELVAYLMSLKSQVPLFETPLPAGPKQDAETTASSEGAGNAQTNLALNR